MSSSARGLTAADHRGSMVCADNAAVIGPWLRQRREGLGVSVPDLANFLKLQPSYIEALEAEAFDRLPGRVYVAGYVRSVAHALGLDPDEAAVRLHDAWPQLALQHEAKLIPDAFAAAERRFPARTLLSLAVAVAIAAYAYWYVNKSAEMGRPLLSPVAELEAPADPSEGRAAPTAPAPGPLRLLGVPELAESLDAASAIGEASGLEMPEQAVLLPLPAEPLPRPRPGTEAASRFAATYALPEANAMTADAATADGTPLAGLLAEELPSTGSLSAYLPSVRLRADLGPLRGTLRLPAAVQSARTDPSAVEPAAPAPSGRTQAFAAVPPSGGLMPPGDGQPERRRVGTRGSLGYDLMAALPQAEERMDAERPPITILADQPCWIEIRTASGEALVQRLVQPGERLDVPAQRGLTLTAGNAGGIRILVDGVTAAALGGVGQVVRTVSLEPHQLLANR